MSEWFWMWLSAFALTQLVETPVYAYALARARSRSLVVCTGYGFLASAITHPVVWWVIPAIVPLSRYELFFAVAEGFALVTEALLMRALGLRRALLWSLLANSLSVVVGSLLRAWVGWP